jgi:hypothetical protein
VHSADAYVTSGLLQRSACTTVQSRACSRSTSKAASQPARQPASESAALAAGQVNNGHWHPPATVPFLRQRVRDTVAPCDCSRDQCLSAVRGPHHGEGCGGHQIQPQMNGCRAERMVRLRCDSAGVGRLVRNAPYLVGCGGVRSSAQQRQHHGGVPPAGCQVQRTAAILQPHMRINIRCSAMA